MIHTPSADDDFAPPTGLPPATLDDVTAAIVSGSKSELLGKLHVALLRLLQCDMEESHLTHQVLLCHHCLNPLACRPQLAACSPCLHSSAPEAQRHKLSSTQLALDLVLSIGNVT